MGDRAAAEFLAVYATLGAAALNEQAISYWIGEAMAGPSKSNVTASMRQIP
jgi:hypothetical protein